MINVNDRVRLKNILEPSYKGTVLHKAVVQEDEEGNGEITWLFVMWDDGIATANRESDLRLVD